MLQTVTNWILMGITVITIPVVILIVVLMMRVPAVNRESGKYTVLREFEKDYWSEDDEDSVNDPEPDARLAERK